MGDDLNARIVALETSLRGFRELFDERGRRYDERTVAQDKAVSIALAASDHAMAKADQASEKRFDSVNEFRAALGDQASALMPRSEYTVQHNSLIERMNAYDARQAEASARIAKNEERSIGKQQGLSSLGAVILGVIAAIAAFAAAADFLARMFH